MRAEDLMIGARNSAKRQEVTATPKLSICKEYASAEDPTEAVKPSSSPGFRTRAAKLLYEMKQATDKEHEAELADFDHLEQVLLQMRHLL